MCPEPRLSTHKSALMSLLRLLLHKSVWLTTTPSLWTYPFPQLQNRALTLVRTVKVFERLRVRASPTPQPLHLSWTRDIYRHGPWADCRSQCCQLRSEWTSDTLEKLFISWGLFSCVRLYSERSYASYRRATETQWQHSSFWESNTFRPPRRSTSISGGLLPSFDSNPYPSNYPGSCLYLYQFLPFGLAVVIVADPLILYYRARSPLVKILYLGARYIALIVLMLVSHLITQSYALRLGPTGLLPERWNVLTILFIEFTTSSYTPF